MLGLGLLLFLYTVFQLTHSQELTLVVAILASIGLGLWLGYKIRKDYE
jgi:hypothetical protein